MDAQENRRAVVQSSLIFFILTLASFGGLMGTSYGITSSDDVQMLPNHITWNAGANEQTYELYLDEMSSEIGGQGTITTLEPTGGQQEGSAVDGLEFRSAEMISDLYINGTGSSNLARLSVYIQFRGSDGSTADLTFALRSGDTTIDTVERELDSPCSSIFPNSGCDWSVIEVNFEVGSNGFKVPNGKQLKIRIDADVNCQGNTGGIGQADCDVDVAFGKMDGSGGFSRLQIMTNALSDSSVKVHSCHPEFGCSWNDEELLEWSPNHRTEFREMHFAIEVRDAFGRDDIEEVTLIMSTPSEANSVFEEEFTDDDLKLDNNGLVGNFTYTYSPGIAAGEYPVRLEVKDVQGHSVVFEHSGIEFLEHDIYFTLPQSQPDVVLIAPGKVSTVEFLIEHTGSTSSSLEVILELARDLPSSWSDPVWDRPAGYTFAQGGSSTRPILSIEVPDADLSNAPSRLEVVARVYAENEQGNRQEVGLKTISLDIEEIDVFAPPRLSIFEDVEHQKQIVDSTRPEAYDETLSHYVDMYEDETSFYIDLFNSGFDTDRFKIKVMNEPDGWFYQFKDNDTGLPLVSEGLFPITEDIGSLQKLTIEMALTPPDDRESDDIGMFTLEFISIGNNELRTEVSFTVHRTFGVLVEVISDSDGSGTDNGLGSVGPVGPNQAIWYNLRLTDSSTLEGTQTTWRIINPSDLDRNGDENPQYVGWDYAISNGTNENLVVVQLGFEEHIDMRLDIQLSGQIEAGVHTIYTRFIEEGVDVDEARYFDLPVKIEIREDVTAGRFEMTQKSEQSRFQPEVTKSLSFQLINENNIDLNVVILLELPSNWDGEIQATSTQLGGNFLILNLPAFESKDFIAEITPPASLKGGQDIEIKFQITPMDNETPYPETYIQTFTFTYKTECSGVGCLISQVVDPEPQTLVLFIIVGALVVYGMSRRQHPTPQWEDPSEEKLTNEMFEDGMPEPVVMSTEAGDSVDDDLELLDELEEL